MITIKYRSSKFLFPTGAKIQRLNVILVITKSKKKKVIALIAFSVFVRPGSAAGGSSCFTLKSAFFLQLYDFISIEQNKKKVL